MYIRVDDGKVIFATHVVRLDQLPSQQITDLNGQLIEQEKVCYSQSETNAYTSILITNSLTYTTETLTWSQDIIQRANDKIFNSRSEAISYLENTLPLSDSDNIVLLKQQLLETQNAVNFLLGL